MSKKMRHYLRSQISELKSQQKPDDFCYSENYYIKLSYQLILRAMNSRSYKAQQEVYSRLELSSVSMSAYGRSVIVTIMNAVNKLISNELDTNATDSLLSCENLAEIFNKALDNLPEEPNETMCCGETGKPIYLQLEDIIPREERYKYLKTKLQAKGIPCKVHYPNSANGKK